jgi:hypothetical protein
MYKMIDSFHFSNFSSLFQIELINLVISERIFLPPAIVNYVWIWFVSFRLSHRHLYLKGFRLMTFSNIYYKTYIQITLQTVLYIICDLKRHITYQPNWNLRVIPSNIEQVQYFQYTVTFTLIHRFMQQLEDALNVSLCGHFLIILAALCFAAFSVVTVQYKNCRVL